eukprot:5182036-Pleurochrysis_carterae.AAC.1
MSRTTSPTSALRLPSTGSRPWPLCCSLVTRASRVGTGSPSWRSTSWALASSVHLTTPSAS